MQGKSLMHSHYAMRASVEPVRGFEPPLQPYKGRVLPLNYTGLVVAAGVAPACNCVSDSRLTDWLHHIGCCGWIRTSASQGNSPVSYRSTTQQRNGGPPGNRT